MDDVLLRVDNLEVSYKQRGSSIEAVSGATFAVRSNECVALIGESGSGKSTIANAVLRVLPENAMITKGVVIFKSRNLLGLTEEQMAKVRGRDISMIFQDPHSSLNPVLKIGDQLTETIMTHNPALGRGKAVERATELLDLVRIPDATQILGRYPHQLSGGMAQRVAIALGLSSNPSLLIADEPTSALDLTIQAQILKLIKRLMGVFKLSVLLITHDLSLVSNLADRVYVMYAGQIVEEDYTDGLYGDPRHPYTVLLLDAVMKLQGVSITLASAIEFREPSELSSCRFRPRCSALSSVCRQKPPPYVGLPSGKKVLCWLSSSSVER